MDFSQANFDPVLVSVAAVFLVCAISLLFLRNSVMWGFVCIIALVVVGVIMLYPEFKWVPQ